jgi:hypothetical protein
MVVRGGETAPRLSADWRAGTCALLFRCAKRSDGPRLTLRKALSTCLALVTVLSQVRVGDAHLIDPYANEFGPKHCKG